MFWAQKTIRIGPYRRGFHLITHQVLAAVPEIEQVQTGLLNVFLQHTSASLTINENADPDVRLDMETAFNRLVPEDQTFVHTIEGPDDMPAHVKSSMLGASLVVPIANGALALGTWQGIYLCEHRNEATPRTLVLTLQGTY
ncbi:MAG: secondary thiamine-phosphate synthase enzyme YjbQ [Pirellula sp.]